ncbi:MAG: twin-arginine translocase TatA/TatE family subunit [Dehalococcoidales bacterium]|nr:twin-arginine translocase TatA/TatE family subunit [Dehalococcoidales bacterium]
MPFKLGPMELGLILLIIIIVFGVGKLPQIGSAFGKTIREFKQATKSDDTTDESKKVAAVKPSSKTTEE